MKGDFKLADFGQDDDLWNGANNRPLFQKVEICWRPPVAIENDGSLSIDNEEDIYQNGYLYSIVRNHHSQATKDKIAYIGITNDLKKRFRNHPKVDEIRGLQGQASISVGVITTPGRRPNGTDRVLIREELEHILIWVLWEDLWNDRKCLVVPGHGKNGGRAYDITNTGFTFSGRMPRRIVYPWAAIIPRRNNTAR